MGRWEGILLLPVLCAEQKSWALDGCSNPGPLTDAKTILGEIVAIKAAHRGGVIQSIVSDKAFSTLIAGVRRGKQ